MTSNSGSIHDTDRAETALGVRQTAKAALSALEAWSPLYASRRAKARQVRALTGVAKIAETELADILFVARARAEVDRHTAAKAKLAAVVAKFEATMLAAIEETHSTNLRTIRRQFQS